MTQRIGGLMDYSKLMSAQPAVASTESDQIPVQHRPPVAAYDQLAAQDFHALTHDEQRAAIHHMARQEHMTDYGISAATGLSVEQIRRLLSEREALVPPKVEERA